MKGNNSSLVSDNPPSLMAESAANVHKRVEETENSNSEAKLREMYHRMQNTLQTIISYINLSSKDDGEFETAYAHKLVRLIHLLNFFQVRSLEELLRGYPEVSVEDIVRKAADLVVNSSSIEYCAFEKLIVGYKDAIALGIIMFELFDNAVKHGDGKIVLKIDDEGLDTPHLVVSNVTSLPILNDTFNERSGQRLIQLLAKGHLPSAVEFRTTLLPNKTTLVEARVPLPDACISLSEVRQK